VVNMRDDRKIANARSFHADGLILAGCDGAKLRGVSRTRLAAGGLLPW